MEIFYDLIKGKQPVLLEFFAQWCPHCQYMCPVLERLEHKWVDKVMIVKYDIDERKNRELMSYYQIQSVPTLVLFKNGEQLWRQSGEMPEVSLDRVLERNL